MSLRSETNYISLTERVYIVLFGSTIFCVNLLNLLVVWNEKVNHPPPFGIYDIARAELYPLSRFLALFIIFFLFFGTRYFAALGWTVLCIAPIIYEFSSRYRIIHYTPEFLDKTSALRVIEMVANPLDFLSFAMLVTLLIWLISVITRSFTLKNAEAEK